MMNGYKSANHDFSLRMALGNMKKTASSRIAAPKNPIPNNEHLWNMAGPAIKQKHDFLSKSRSEPTIPSNAVLEATQQFDRGFTVHTEKQKGNDTKTEDTVQEEEYAEDAAKQIVSQFCHRFPAFKSKLSEQFPEEWLNLQPANQHQETHDATKLFQYSQLCRDDRERIIQELYEYGVTEQQKWCWLFNDAPSNVRNVCVRTFMFH